MDRKISEAISYHVTDDNPASASGEVTINGTTFDLESDMSGYLLFLGKVVNSSSSEDKKNRASRALRGCL
jgi:hypothetical protein